MAKRRGRPPKAREPEVEDAKKQMRPPSTSEITELQQTKDWPRKLLVLERPDKTGFIVMIALEGMKQYSLQMPNEQGGQMMLDIFQTVLKYGVKHGKPFVQAAVAGGRRY